MVNLLQFDRGALGPFCEQLGEKRFRATQLFRWIHQRGEADFAAMSDLARPFRDKLVAQAEVRALPIASERIASDGTIKWLFDVGAGDAVETVFIPESGRGTLCISSQAGCAVNCRFCATGHQGFSRNLTTAEIVAQLWRAAPELCGAGAGAEDDARRPRLRPVAAPGHGVDLGGRAHDRSPARRLPGCPRDLAPRPRRCAARRARAAQPQVPDRRTPRFGAALSRARAARRPHARASSSRRRSVRTAL